MAPITPAGHLTASENKGRLKAHLWPFKKQFSSAISHSLDSPDPFLVDGSLHILGAVPWLTLVAFLLAGYTGVAFSYLGLTGALYAFVFLVALVAQSFLVRTVLMRGRRTRKMADLESGLKSGKKDAAPDLSQLPAVSYLYILGSGGHTTEMMALIKQSFKANKNQHRRYIITDGDTHSLSQSKGLEKLIRTNCPDDAGTHDAFIVTRARAVHQSFFTSVFTSANCALEITAALTTVPPKRAGQPNAEGFKYPHVIVTNGPGTGFIVGLVAFALKVLWCAPEDRLKVVFVETWARDHKLGLTGKLFEKTGIADLFVVQSQTLARAVGKANIGNVNFRYAQLPRPAVDSNQSRK